ncbi:peptidylprolyl isomerase [Roseibium hamelinense]|uniref:Peptidyl-prolyl cis-trans isomerase n=1 Tax=Roseibium hamelinense TaxID=150831 RepID=A0A562T0U7_9HYPH|nr:peptidylprolyl isomerase [Roseibium hamelinense]MTI44555.1 peptidylprolyl isomerase [Roseibium hamelinense]TWI87181.1 peptidylprolyl isomerase [Roseibium hamelinense]
MTEVKSGDTVRIHYKGSLTDGTVFDSSEGREPLEFTVGSGQIIPGLEQAMTGMKVGESKTVQIAPEDAYGPLREEALQEVPRAQMPENIPLEVGTQLQVQNPDGQVMPVRISAVSDEAVLLDANHPLAGRELVFDVSLVEIA